ncbi:hypothetical protein B0I37DRAFT_77964 [Chaetomium sp. MPI-CAGE-AT-0009]|nr:hypothetical protein B0I37DRAFT_77964 [Chaetomium sp. MPI-CAGE-AT-0009]
MSIPHGPTATVSMLRGYRIPQNEPRNTPVFFTAFLSLPAASPPLPPTPHLAGPVFRSHLQGPRSPRAWMPPHVASRNGRRFAAGCDGELIGDFTPISRVHFGLNWERAFLAFLETLVILVDPRLVTFFFFDFSKGGRGCMLLCMHQFAAAAAPTGWLGCLLAWVSYCACVGYVYAECNPDYCFESACIDRRSGGLGEVYLRK